MLASVSEHCQLQVVLCYFSNIGYIRNLNLVPLKQQALNTRPLTQLTVLMSLSGTFYVCVHKHTLLWSAGLNSSVGLAFGNFQRNSTYYHCLLSH